MNWHWINRISWVIIALISVSLGVLNVFLLHKEIDISPTTLKGLESNIPNESVATSNVVILDGAMLSQTLARPLFSPTRRQFTPEQKTTEQATFKPTIETKNSRSVARSIVVFQGTRKIGKERQALVKISGGEAAEWLPIGAQIANWTIIDIGDDTLVLSKLGHSTSYELFSSEEKE